MTATRGVILIDDPACYERFSMPFGETATIRIVSSSASLGTSSELTSWERTYGTNLESEPLAPSSYSNRHERRRRLALGRRSR